MEMAYTTQNCIKCGKTVVMDFLERLLHLDEPVICEECKNKGGEEDERI